MNQIDKALIIALQKDGRVSNVELASQLDIHVATVAKRVEALEKSGLITIRALPNPYMLGYTAHAFIAIKADSHRIDEVCARLAENFHVNLVVTVFGRYDVLAIAYYPDWESLFDMISRDLAAEDGIRAIDTFLVEDIIKRNYGYSNTVRPVKVDETDRILIERLTENGRLKIYELAKDIGISPPTCSRRVARLLNKKVIEIRAVANMARLSTFTNAFMFLRVRPDRKDEICETLRADNDVYLIMTLINAVNIVIGFNAANPEDLYRFKNAVLFMDGVLESETIVRAEIRKRYYGGSLT